MSETPTLFIFRQFAERHPAFTVPGLRWIRFKGEENGFSDAFVKVAGRVLIDEDKFFQIIAEQNGNGTGADAA